LLAVHHDCGAPLFRYRGVVVCPVCSFGDADKMEPADRYQSAKDQEDLFVQSRQSGPNSIQPSSSSEGIADSVQAPSSDERPASSVDAQPGREIFSHPHTQEDDLAHVRTALFSKLRELSSAVEKEQDLSRLKSLLDCMEASIRAIRAMNGMKD